jgi:hypothetical protein
MIRRSNNTNEENPSFCQNQRNSLEFPITTQKVLVVTMIMRTLSVRCTSGLTASAAFRTDIALGNRSVNENTSVSTLVGKLSTTDPDTGDTLTYPIQTPRVPLQINGSGQELGGPLNLEASSSYYNITIRTPDAGDTSSGRVRVSSRLYKIGPKAE